MIKPRAETELLLLDWQLARLRRRVSQLRRGVEHGGAHWTVWSNSLDEAFGLIDRMMPIRVDSVTGLVVKLGALIWLLDETDAVLDLKAMRQLRTITG